MHCKTFISALLFSLLSLALSADAQTRFVVTKQQFDNLTKDWKYASERSHFWLTPDGNIDSLVIEDPADPSQFRVLKNWRTLSWHSQSKVYHTAPTGLLQFGTDGKVPLRTEYHHIKEDDTSIIAIDSAFVLDSLLVSYYKFSFPQNYYSYQFRYAPGAEMTDFSIVRSFDGWVSKDQEMHAERLTDSLGRVTQFVSYLNILGKWGTLDSQLFAYDSNNTLRSAIVWRFRDGRVVAGDRYEYYDWQEYRANQYSFQENEIAVGGDRFLRRSWARWYVDAPGWEPYIVENKEYGSDGSLSRTITTVPSGSSMIETISYYNNGDLREYAQRYFSDSTFKTLSLRDNVYGDNGALISSEWTLENGVRYRYSFTYPSLQVEESQNADQSYLQPNATFGNTLQVEQGASFEVFTLLGSSAMQHVASESVVTLNLPSGLYFISIDGGKPRKHLIP